jgi:hypothetical protein
MLVAEDTLAVREHTLRQFGRLTDVPLSPVGDTEDETGTQRSGMRPNSRRRARGPRAGIQASDASPRLSCAFESGPAAARGHPRRSEIRQVVGVPQAIRAEALTRSPARSRTVRLQRVAGGSRFAQVPLQVRGSIVMRYVPARRRIVNARAL